MTDTTIETPEADNTATDSQAEYEALRDSQFDEPEEQEAAEPEATEEPEQKAEAPDVEKLQKSLRERSGAARREREARLAAEQRAAEFEARLAALEGGNQDDPLAALKEDDSDPIGDLEALKRIVRGMAQAGDQEKAQRAQAQQQMQNVRNLSDWAAEYENDFREQHTDYDAAASHVAEGRKQELLLMHGGDEQKAQAAFMQEMLGLVAECKQRNLDPAETVYNLAKTRGYKNGVAIDNAAEKTQTIKRGQAAAKSLGSVGKAESSELSYEAINAIKNPEQRYAAFEKMRAREQEAAKYG